MEPDERDEGPGEGATGSDADDEDYGDMEAVPDVPPVGPDGRDERTGEWISSSDLVNPGIGTVHASIGFEGERGANWGWGNDSRSPGLRRSSEGSRVSGERAYRIVELREQLGGDFGVELVRELTTEVYRGPTALRWVRHDAKMREAGEALLVLVRPTGAVAGVWLSGSGRKATGSLVRRAKRAVQAQLPELFTGRRTSRPVVANGSHRRSSRAKHQVRSSRARGRRTSKLAGAGRARRGHR